MTADNHVAPPSEENSLPPGAWLRRVRTDKKIQPEQVCAYLGITRHRLQVLEDDDYCRLPAEVYVRGWIRRYCVMLGLPGEAVLSSFDEQLRRLREQKLERQLQAHKLRQQRTLRRAAVGGIVLLAVAGLAWLVGGPYPGGAPHPVAETFEQTGDEGERPVATMPRELLGLSSNDSDESGLAHLEVRFSADSWVEVLDSAGNILLADLKLANEVVLLAGIPPFEVYVANAPAVELRYRGELLQLAMGPKGQGVRTLIGDNPMTPLSSPDGS